jgi:hypothetical protein
MKRWIDDLIQIEFGYPDLEFAFVKATSIDPQVQSEIDDRDLRNGSKAIDEVRHARGDDPLPDGLGARPMLYIGTGAVLLESVTENRSRPGTATGAPQARALAPADARQVPADRSIQSGPDSR